MTQKKFVICYEFCYGGYDLNRSEIDMIEKKKRDLKRYKRNKSLIARLQDKLSVLNDRITSARSPNLSGMPRGGIPVTTADLIAEKQELEDRIHRLSDKGSRYRREILDEIDSLEDVRHSEILEYFFIDGLTPEEIADVIPCNVRTVYRLYSEAVKILSLGESE